MDEDFIDFLETRTSITEEFKSFVKTENIDCSTLLLMKEDDISRLIPKLGDRLAVIDFCKKKLNPVNKRKKSLLDRLREKVNKKQKTNDTIDTITDTTVNENKTSVELSKGITRPGRKFKNNDRLIYLGWITDTSGRFKQVRAKQGGGARRLYINKFSKKADILELAKSMFFKNGESSIGNIDQFIHELVDFSQEEIVDDEISIETMYIMTGMNVLRFYLKSTKKKPSETNDETNEPMAPQLTNFIESTETTYVTENVLVSDQEYSFDTMELTDFSAPDIETPAVEASGIEPRMFDDGPFLIHRGHEFKELLKIFMTLTLDDERPIKIRMIQPNGELEKGVDTGGVFRDCITAFWNDFYDMCTEGTTSKVPCIRHDFQEQEWAAAAKILKKGWTDEGYFPVLLNSTFVQYVVFNTISSNMITDFINMMSDDDGKLIKNALEEFPCEQEVLDELLEVLSNYKTVNVPTADNFKILLSELAHKEIIQKSSFIIDVWKNIINGMFDLQTYKQIIETGKPSAKNILKNLVCDVDIDHDQQMVFNYLKRYIKEIDDIKRSAFLRFCTGSNIANKSIKVTFTKTISQFARCPVAHVCACNLELNYPFQSFQEFRQELNAVLNSDIWVMDIA